MTPFGLTLGENEMPKKEFLYLHCDVFENIFFSHSSVYAFIKFPHIYASKIVSAIFSLKKFIQFLFNTK